MTPDEYQQAVRELAGRAAMPEGVAERMQAELERAFEGSVAASVAGSKDPALRNRRWSVVALAAAAAIVIAVGASSWYARQQSATPNDVTASVALPVPTATAAGLKPRPTEDAAVTPSVKPRPAKPRRLPPVIQPAGFVPVPTAARLPQFESGLIVRVALPAAALPSYGVDISPAATDQPIEADVLLGQDGLARAIRLVNTSRSQQ
jgi:hypothetical protein